MIYPRSIYFLLIAFPFFVIFLFFRYQSPFDLLPHVENETMLPKISMIQQMNKEKESMLQQIAKERESMLQQIAKEKESMLQQLKMKQKEPTVSQNIGVNDLCTLIDKGIAVDSWWKYVCLIERSIDKPVGYNCKDAKNMGNWKICFDEKYSPIRPDKPCLVYSFGIAGDFTFDEAMAKKGCEVYSFDPSMGLEDYTHSKNVYFKNIGLSHVDDDNFSPRFDIYVKKPQIWKTRTLRSVMKMLKHEKRVIDVLKFDIELAEWKVMMNIIQDGMLPKIRQLLTEWHIFPRGPKRDELKTFYEMHRDLPSHGLETFYRRGHTRRHSNILKFNSQAESCFVNVNFTDPK
ncbi:hypothetical protein LOTGIDRAFT_160586 [Lottia gigantea]|uniref:Methyltransferase domain-containing protein n=1 Tax=Lottia gigantea TaxID=225164 RepID=V3ZVB9_LOTGI|nr:hypothetical protein LOTGIDRAFT_160586 [Lottia gigantea]ESO95438.1 hypothetical protein LOTGIDRAFT_160586 [Lottia gigantea]